MPESQDQTVAEVPESSAEVSTEIQAEELVEEVSIDGMCGVY